MLEIENRNKGGRERHKSFNGAGFGPVINFT